MTNKYLCIIVILIGFQKLNHKSFFDIIFKLSNFKEFCIIKNNKILHSN